MKKPLSIYLYEPCTIIATNLADCLSEMECNVHLATATDTYQEDYQAIVSDLAIIALSPAYIFQAANRAAQLYWQYQLPIIWTSPLPIAAYPKHYILHQGLPVIYKPFTNHQFKTMVRKEIIKSTEL